MKVFTKSFPSNTVNVRVCVVEQGPQKLSSLKSLKIQNSLCIDTGNFRQEMALLSISKSKP